MGGSTPPVDEEQQEGEEWVVLGCWGWGEGVGKEHGVEGAALLPVGKKEEGKVVGMVNCSMQHGAKGLAHCGYKE